MMEDMKIIENINNYKEILKYKEKLESLKKYKLNKEIIRFVQEDISEINEIQKELKNKRNVSLCI